VAFGSHRICEDDLLPTGRKLILRSKREDELTKPGIKYALSLFQIEQCSQEHLSPVLQRKFVKMVNCKTLVLCLATIFVAFSAVSEARADTLTFSNVVALQNNGSLKVDLFSNQGVTLIGPTVSFLVDIKGILPPGATDTLRVTYAEFGSASIVQTFQIPAFGVVPPPFQQLFTFTSAGANFSGVGATLTLDILGTSPDFVIPSGPNAGQEVNTYTYTFKVAQPVPEPGSLFLFGSAVSILGAAVWKRRG
jgi:PEP-CTERM motif